ncbi:MAG: hypothetical protein ACQSGP_01905 [Frankia sp.]
MATFIGFLLFSAPLALFFGFVIWLVPAMFFPEQMARRRPGVFGYVVTGYVLLAVLSLYLVASAGHDAAPLIGTVLSFAAVYFLRERYRQRRPVRSGRPSRWASLMTRLGLGNPADYGMGGPPYGDATDPESDDGDPSEGGSYRYGPTGTAPPVRPGDGPSRRARDEGIPDTDPM